MSSWTGIDLTLRIQVEVSTLHSELKGIVRELIYEVKYQTSAGPGEP